MIRRVIPVISIVILSVLAVFFLIESFSTDRELLENTFVVDAVYFEQEGYVEITFEDTSEKTTLVVLEILGMPDSFQKIFTTSAFVERVPFSEPPKYGWQTSPVTFVIEHPEFGQVGLKTEIHPQGEPARPIIYSDL